MNSNPINPDDFKLTEEDIRRFNEAAAKRPQKTNEEINREIEEEEANAEYEQEEAAEITREILNEEEADTEHEQEEAAKADDDDEGDEDDED
jgi:hypothetical protein